MGLDVLVVNLTRFGDLLQTQPLLHAAHRAGLRCGLVCLDNFAPALPLLRHVEAAWPLHGARMLKLVEEEGGRRWKEAAAFALESARAIRKEAAPRRVLNLTATLSSRLWMRMLSLPDDGGECVPASGFAVDADGYGLCGDLWTAYLGGTVLRRDNAPFNLADMFRRTLASAAPAGFCAAGGRGLAEPSPEAGEAILARGPEVPFHVGFQLGASASIRQWPVEHFAALGRILHEETGACPVLLGGPGERALAGRYAALADHPHIDAVGATDLPALASLTSRLRLLVSNDTGTLHLAAGLGVPSLSLFLATAQPCDTGPYLPGCACLEPALECHPCQFGVACPHGERCRAAIRPEGVARLAVGRLNTGGWEAGMSDALKAEARVWVTEEDSQGFADLRCLSGHEAEIRTRWLRLQREWWRRMLDSMTAVLRGEAPAAPGGAATATAEGFLPPDEAAMLAGAVRHAAILPEMGRLLGRSVAAGRRFLQAGEDVQTALDACRHAPALGRFWREMRQTLAGDLGALTGCMEIFARDLAVLAAACGAEEGRGGASPAA